MISSSDLVFEIIDRSQLDDNSDASIPVARQCDCACSTTLARPEAWYDNVNTLYDPFRTPLLYMPQLSIQTLEDGYWSVFNPTAEFGVVLLNQHAYRLLHLFEEPFSPIQALQYYDDEIKNDVKQAIAKLSSLKLLQQPQEQKRLLTNQADTLSVWLHITNQCNLRCTYCYLNKTNEHMSAETGQAAIDAVIRSATSEGYSRIELKYAGGEAALEMHRVLEIHDYASMRCQEHEIELQAVILSNGTTLQYSEIEALKTSGIKVMVSLDGLGHSHDVQRPYLGGQNSARQVIEGIDQLVECGLPPHLSITISAHNCDTVDEVVRFALERDLTFSFSFYRENDCSASFGDLRYDESNMIAGLKKAFEAIEENLPPWTVVGAVLDRGNLISPHEHATCGVGQDYMVIDHYGRITKCHMEMDKPITDVHHNNPLEVIRLSPIGVQNPSVHDKEGCRDCEWKYWCSGGCPITTYRATGRYDIKNPNCNIYKAIYPEVIRLEGLRLQKYRGDSTTAVRKT